MDSIYLRTCRKHTIIPLKDYLYWKNQGKIIINSNKLNIMAGKKLIYTILFILAVLSFYSFIIKSTAENDKWTKTELYFGMSKNTGGSVSTEEWNAFEDSVIVKVFSAGSTTIDSKGRWLNENGDVIKESSKIVIAVNKMTPELSAAIDTVREKYKRYFDQSSVLRIEYEAGVSF